MVPWAHPSPQPKRHLDRFQPFLHDALLRQTDRPTQTDRPRYSVGSNRPHLGCRLVKIRRCASTCKTIHGKKTTNKILATDQQKCVHFNVCAFIKEIGSYRFQNRLESPHTRSHRPLYQHFYELLVGWIQWSIMRFYKRWHFGKTQISTNFNF